MRFYVHLEGTVAGGSCSQLGRVTVPVDAADTRDALRAVGAAIGSLLGRAPDPIATPACSTSPTPPVFQKLQADFDRLEKTRFEQSKIILSLQRRLNFVGTRPCPKSEACSFEDGHSGPCFITRKDRKKILAAELERDEAKKALEVARAETQGLKNDVAKMASRTFDLEARIHALGGMHDPLIPGSTKSISQSQNEAANAELERLRALAKAQEEAIKSLNFAVGDREHRISLLEHAARQTDECIRVADIQSRKQGDALAAAEKKAAQLEAINLDTEYYKARSMDLQTRLDASERVAKATMQEGTALLGTLNREREQARQYKVAIEAARDGLLRQQAHEIQVAMDTEREVIARKVQDPDVGRNQYDLCAWIRSRIKDPASIRIR